MTMARQRALAAAVAQPPPGRRGGPPWRPRRPGRHGVPWLLPSSALVAVAAVALVLLTGIGQRSGAPAGQPTAGSGNGAASSPLATSYARTVPATHQWTGTGIALHAGDRLGITASGEIHVSPSSAVGPAGNPRCTPAVNDRADSAQFPGPGLPCWSLIARIGSGAPFEVGTATRITAASGELYLGVNDDDLSANSGRWAAAITVG